MKKKYSVRSFLRSTTQEAHFLGFQKLFLFGIFYAGSLFSQQSYTFTTAGATGRLGPTQLQINAAYFSTNLNGSVVCTAGVQSFTIPTSGLYRISARGAQGAGANGGFGAMIEGEFNFLANDVIRIVVGQQGVTQSGEPNACGGGGGSYVMRSPLNATTNILVIAGGGGGSAGTYSISRHATIGTSGNNGAGVDNTDGAGGLNGNGGNKSVSASSLDRAAGGGGFFTDGQSIAQTAGAANGGSSFLNGSNGGSTNTTGADGGFGGGGAVWTTGFRGAGGGGGYSGGGGGQTNSNTNTQVGGGGGSFNSATSQTNAISTATGDGIVIISEACNVRIFSSLTGSVNPSICSGTTLTLSTNAVSGYSWSTNQTGSSIVVSPAVTTTYSLSATSSLACTGSAFMTVTVSAGLPVLSISNPSNNICLGRTVSLTATGALTYTWTGGVVNGQTFTPTSTQSYTVSGQNGCGISTSVTSITVASLPVSALASPTLVCMGYPATLTAISAVNGYTWQPIALYGSTVVVSPMANTIYTVTASDGTCSGTQTLALTTKISPTITATASSTNICLGSSVVLTANGALTYNWMPGNLSGNTITVSPNNSVLYSVDGTNSVGCTASANQVIVVIQSPTLNVYSNKPLACVGSVISLTASGASSYTWTNGPFTAVYNATLSGTTTYTVSGTSGTNVCVGSKTISVSAFIPTVSLVSTPTDVCLGNSATLTANGVGGFTLSGPGGPTLPVVSPTVATIYTLSATSLSNGVNCSSTSTVQVGVNPNPTVTIVPTKTLICKFDSNILTASGALTYTWNGGATGATLLVIPTSQTNSSYTVTGSNINGCVDTRSYLVNVVLCGNLGKEFSNGNSNVLIYPNPSSAEFVIETTGNMLLSLVNGLGQEIRLISLTDSNKHQAVVKDLASGVYFLLGENPNGKINRKIVVAQ